MTYSARTKNNNHILGTTSVVSPSWCERVSRIKQDAPLTAVGLRLK
jgi:hypothetical protein